MVLARLREVLVPLVALLMPVMVARRIAHYDIILDHLRRSLGTQLGIVHSGCFSARAKVIEQFTAQR